MTKPQTLRKVADVIDRLGIDDDSILSICLSVPHAEPRVHVDSICLMYQVSGELIDRDGDGLRPAKKVDNVTFFSVVEPPDPIYTVK